MVWPIKRFSELLKPNKRPYTLGPTEDANLVGMRLYGGGPFHREMKPATAIRKKSHFVIRAGDVIYNKLFAWKGTFGVVPPGLDGMFVSDKFPTYELDSTRVDPEYIRWYFKYPPLWEQARQMSIGSAALSKLTLNPPRFLDLTMPLPSVSEQRRIVSRIEGLASRISEARDLRRHSGHEARALLKAHISRLANSFGTLGVLGEVLLEQPRNGWSARCDNLDGGVPVLTLGAVTGFRYGPRHFKTTSLPTDSAAHYWLKTGDLLITRSNTPQLVGHAAIYDGTPSPCIYPDLMMRIRVDERRADKQFVWYWLQGSVARGYIERNARGTSPSMKKIAQATVMGVPFPVHVSLEEQARFVAGLNTLQERIDLLERLQAESAAPLDALLPSLLDKAFKGEL